ncbi:MAG: aldehyde dehydrogenase family protein [Deltaproteobacteria bacterium]|nr:aldehyde dehydrogenase family protein [Deltaproteobacteria bacterium]
MDSYKLFIDGKFVDAASKKTFETIDPGSGTPIASVARAGVADAEAAIAAARRAFDSGVWSGLNPAARMAKMQDFADQVAQQGLRLAATESMDSGQIVNLCKLWPLAMVTFMRNLSLAATRKFPWEEEIPASGNILYSGRDYIRREPIGVCVGIVPWNFPMYIAMWKIAPALIMGNTMVLKPASLTPLSALIIAEAAKAAGIPDGVLNIIPGPGGELGKVLCTHKDVDKISLTGSTEVGREIMKLAADTVKKVTLELGGKSANIILDDADMDLAVEGACFGTFFHQGQVCSSGTRVFVHAKIYDEFVSKMKKRAEAYRIGYQLDPNSHLGPLVSREQFARVDSYVKIGKEEGAELITGGARAEVPGLEGGYYYKPTIFTNVKNSMRIAQEEIFGPVVSVIRYDSDEEAIAIANDSIYGLAGGVFSSNTARAERIARGVRTGTMWINNYHMFADFCPFGGYKQSGVGRDFGMECLHDYSQVKRVHISGMADAKSNMTWQMLSDYKKVDGFTYYNPTAVIAGHGSLASIMKVVTDFNCRRALILTDSGVNQAGLAELAKNALGDFCVRIYDRIPSDPDLETVDAATAHAREVKADCIVSVGGGSVIDTGKGVCVTLKNGGKANDHLNLLILTEPQTPHIVIPTTAGTGSEVTNISVLTSHGAGRKLFIADKFITPNAAILDPRFTMSLPKRMTVGSAMDAMTHAVEAMMGSLSNRISDGNALQAIRLINENLPLAAADGQNERARLNLQIAATLAGWAFNVSQVGLGHAMAHTLGTLFHLPHGEACGLMLPGVMRYNVDYATSALAQVAQALQVDTKGMKEHDAALAAADAIEALMKKVGHPLKLRDVGIEADALDMAAFHAICDTACLFNARPVSDPGEVAALYKQAF